MFSAAARIGKSVLHLDANAFYGESCASFDLDCFNELLGVNKLPAEADTEKTPQLQSKRFNIDYVPEVLFSAGTMIDTLISSGVGKYVEFKRLERSLLFENGKISIVPTSRSDVFKTKEISLFDKRALMRFFNSLIGAEGEQSKVDVAGMKSSHDPAEGCRIS